MNVAEFIDKWRNAELTERSASQQHFLDLCELLDHPPSPKGDPIDQAEVDRAGEFFTFERGATKKDGSDGWAFLPLKPGTTSEAITADAARRVAELAVALRERGLDPHDVAHFLDRIVFSYFAEDAGLLPGMVVTRLLEQSRAKPERFPGRVRGLFQAMKEGGYFGVDEIRRQSTKRGATSSRPAPSSS